MKKNSKNLYLKNVKNFIKFEKNLIKFRTLHLKMLKHVNKVIDVKNV